MILYLLKNFYETAIFSLPKNTAKLAEKSYKFCGIEKSSISSCLRKFRKLLMTEIENLTGLELFGGANPIKITEDCHG